MSAFFELYQGLTREGPGDSGDVAWAAQVGGVKNDAQICDAACGSGADIAALLRTAPNGHVTAIDKQRHFIFEARARHGINPRVAIQQGDMAQITGPFDFIWSAGAVYFMGIENALKTWKPALASGGMIAFSELCWWDADPSSKARDFWEKEYPAMTDQAGIKAQIGRAGFRVVASKPVSQNGWEGYYTSLEHRIDTLRPTANAELRAVIDKTEDEIATWRACPGEYGYLLNVVRPL